MLLVSSHVPCTIFIFIFYLSYFYLTIDQKNYFMGILVENLSELVKAVLDFFHISKLQGVKFLRTYITFSTVILMLECFGNPIPQ